jgi:glutamyl-tRNA synthetase
MFYDAQKEDLQWLGISWDKEYCTSAHLPTHYKLAEQLIEQGDAYLCRCTADDIKHGRYHAKACSCRDKSKGSMIDTWDEFINGGEEGGILRLKGDMQSVNTAMRDPTLFRVIDAEHPLEGTKYRVWPTYDFAGAVEDSISGVTHPFRTKEYELRDAVYFHLLSLLKLRKPHLMEFARLSIKGMPVSKRKIKPLIDQGIVSGYDDPRLPTLRGLQRRGIVPEAIKQFVIEQGLSKVESTVDFSVLEAVNRKHLDPQVKRFFFVPDPHKLEVTKAPKTTVDLPFHPTEKLGTRKVQTESTFYIPGDEATQFKKGDIFRLKELYNVTVLSTGKSLKVQYAGKDILPNTKKLQWVTDNSIPFSILKPGLLFKGDTVDKESMQTITGRAEQAIQTVSPGEIIQFERVGFTRIETTDTNQQQGIFAHK